MNVNIILEQVHDVMHAIVHDVMHYHGHTVGAYVCKPRKVMFFDISGKPSSVVLFFDSSGKPSTVSSTVLWHLGQALERTSVHVSLPM